MYGDRAKDLSKLIVALGLAYVWPGPELIARVLEWRIEGRVPAHVEGMRPPRPAPPSPRDDARAWYADARPHCNAVEAATWLRAEPAPEGFEGTSYAAACLALAGRVPEARARIDGLDATERTRAAAIVFQEGHPAADAGDDLAAGPLMELVVEYAPNNYMALYHAGAAAWQRGEADRARAYLERFLERYDVEDGWRSSARSMLAQGR